MCQVGCIINMHRLISSCYSEVQRAGGVQQKGSALPLDQDSNPGHRQAKWELALYWDSLL